MLRESMGILKPILILSRRFQPYFRLTTFRTDSQSRRNPNDLEVLGRLLEKFVEGDH